MSGINSTVKVVAAFTPALTITAITFIASKVVDKFSGDLTPSELTVSKDKIQITFSDKPKKTLTVSTLDTADLDEYEIAFDVALKAVVAGATQAPIKGAQWIISETRR